MQLAELINRLTWAAGKGGVKCCKREQNEARDEACRRYGKPRLNTTQALSLANKEWQSHFVVTE